jgi:hypothetical protein
MAVDIGESPSKSATDGVVVPRLTVVQAVQRHVLLAVTPIAILLVLAFAIAVARKPTYSSVAPLNVGGVQLSIQTIPGYSVAVAQLAVAYSRAIYATPVVARVSRRVGVPPDQIVGHVTATPIEQTPVIRIQASASNPGQAQRLADATASALVAYAAKLQGNNPDTPRLLRRYVADTQAVQEAGRAVKQSSGADHDRAQTRLSLAVLQQRTDALLYQQSTIGDAATSLITKIAPASGPKSDRRSVFQRLVLSALIGGGLIGVGLALARARRESLRRIAPP